MTTGHRKEEDIPLDSREKALRVARLALDKKAADTVVLQMKDLTSFTDYFVICSGESTTQVRAISEHILETLRQMKIKPVGVEGLSNATWVLIDLGDVVAHVFEAATRDFYGLEKLWLDAPRVDLG